MDGTKPCFALVVGVNEYDADEATSLKGCVNDSQEMVDYLRDTFHIPESMVERYIKHLTNEHATREAILNAFVTHLIENPDIKEGDPILFFFAGHGGRQPTKMEGWIAQHGNVEVICPYNVGSANGIPDYTMAALLRQLQHAKGRNITIILDSCHSGGMDRGPDVGLAIRTYNPPSLLPDDLDAQILSRASPDIGSEDPVRPGGMNDALRSSVLLAACAPEKTAHEAFFEEDGKIHGVFTISLIKKMKAHPDETYWRLIEEVKKLPSMSLQMPCCVGTYQHRRLFSIDTDHRFSIYIDPEDDKYYVNAGWIHGVEVDTTVFTLRPTITLSPESVEGDRSSLKPSSHLNPTTIGVKVTMNNERQTRDLFDLYLRHQSRKEHGLGAGVSQDMLRCWTWMCCRRWKPTKPLVELVIKRLTVDRRFAIFKPDPNSDTRFVTPSSSDPPRIGDAQIRSSDTYGFQLVNNGTFPLYVYMFYFDPAVCSIELWYSSDSPLVPKSNNQEDHILILLAENGGWLGKRFFPHGDRKKDDGFIKVYVSNERVNMAHIPCFLSATQRADSVQTLRPKRGHAWVSLLYKITCTK